MTDGSEEGGVGLHLGLALSIVLFAVLMDRLINEVKQEFLWTRITV